MEILTSPSFLITYAVLQTIVLLLLVRAVDVYEHEALSILGLLCLWGAVGATALSVIGNRFVHTLLPADIDLVFGSAIAAPSVEELAKGIALVVAVIAVGWAHRRFGTARFGGFTDGLVYGAAVGLGFAFTEDLYYLVVDIDATGLVEAVETFARRRDFIGFGMLHHAIFTGLFGAGLGAAAWSRSWFKRIALPFAGLAAAMVLHAINNGIVRFTLVQRFGFDRTLKVLEAGRAGRRIDAAVADAGQMMLILDYAVVVGFLIALFFALRRQRGIIDRELAPELDSGLLDRRDLEMARSPRKRSALYWRLARSAQVERARSVRRLHNEVTELAFAKWLRGKGVTSDAQVARARQDVATLKAAAEADVYAPGSRDQRGVKVKTTGKETIIEMLGRVPLLSGCSRRDLSLLADIADEVSYPAGETIFREGDEGLGLEVIVEGSVHVEVGGQDRGSMGPGSFFGEVALLDGGPRSATLVAESDVTVIRLPAYNFNAVLESQPAIARNMLPDIARRLRSAGDQAGKGAARNP